MKNVAIIFIVVFLMQSASVLSADTIYFKDGKVVTGNIIEEDSYKIKVSHGKFPRVYYRHKIDRIERDKEVSEYDEVSYGLIVGEVTDEKRELIVRLLEVNGIRDSLIIMFQQILSEAPDEAKEELRNLMGIDDMMKQVIPIYAKRYTVAEIRELLLFYKSPTGSKHIKLGPKIMEEMMLSIGKYLQESAKNLPMEEE